MVIEDEPGRIVWRPIVKPVDVSDSGWIVSDPTVIGDGLLGDGGGLLGVIVGALLVLFGMLMLLVELARLTTDVILEVTEFGLDNGVVRLVVELLKDKDPSTGTTAIKAEEVVAERLDVCCPDTTLPELEPPERVIAAWTVGRVEVAPLTTTIGRDVETTE